MSELIKSYYENYNEDGRLFRDKAHLPEWLTTIKYFDRLFKPNSRILDACAGTGIYSFYLAEKGHDVIAADLSEHNINILKNKPNAEKLADIDVCNVLDLSQFEENSFDAVLCMGALYHLKTVDEKKKAITECVRVCKKNGFIALSYLNKYPIIIDEISPNIDNIDYILNFNEEPNNIFMATTPKEIINLSENNGIKILHNIGTDGLSFILRDKINSASDENFEKWMNFMYETCEDEHILGLSMHGLLIGRKE